MSTVGQSSWLARSRAFRRARSPSIVACRGRASRFARGPAFFATGRVRVVGKQERETENDESSPPRNGPKIPHELRTSKAGATGMHAQFLGVPSAGAGDTSRLARGQGRQVRRPRRGMGPRCRADHTDVGGGFPACGGAPHLVTKGKRFRRAHTALYW